MFNSDTDFIVSHGGRLWRRNKRNIKQVKRYLAYIYGIKKTQYHIVTIKWFIGYKDMKYMLSDEENI